MTLFSIFLVLLSAVFHALWNFVAKRARGGASFVWLFGVMEVFIYLPVIIYLIVTESPTLTLTGLIFVTGSAILHLAYFILLSMGYRVGDLSLVYPLARAIGPLIATVFAILLLGERPTLVAVTGSLLICGGVFWLTGDPRKFREQGSLAGVRFACFTGLAIAGYTLWDAYAVSQIMIAPLLFQWCIGAIRVLLLTPYVLRHWSDVELAWRDDKWKAAFVAVFSALSYLLILITLTVSPVSYVAPMRVISTLIGVGLGAQFLKEGYGLRRFVAAGVMVLGVIFLSVG